jgi:hypothetical protein
VGRDRISQVLPFSMEVRDSPLLLLVMGFCVGLVFVVIIGVCQGADICMVSLWCHSNLREKKHVIGLKNVCGMLVTCEGFIMYLGNVHWYLRGGACYPTTSVCVDVL